MEFSSIQNIEKFLSVAAGAIKPVLNAAEPLAQTALPNWSHILWLLEMNEEKFFSVGISTHFSHALRVKTPVAECK